MSLERIVKRLDRSADALERIADCLEKVVEQTQTGNVEQPIALDDSTGSCPNCESVDVTQVGNYPNSIYRCGNCQGMWANYENTFFNS